MAGRVATRTARPRSGSRPGRSANSGTNAAQTSTSSYDANGHLSGITDDGQSANNRQIYSDAAGRALLVDQGGRLQRQLIVGGEMLGRYGIGLDDLKPRVKTALGSSEPQCAAAARPRRRPPARSCPSSLRASLGQQRLDHPCHELRLQLGRLRNRLGLLLSMGRRPALAVDCRLALAEQFIQPYQQRVPHHRQCLGRAACRRQRRYQPSAPCLRGPEAGSSTLPASVADG